MKTRFSRTQQAFPAGHCAYLMIEALVYISLVFVLLGLGYAAMYRCIDSSLALRRNADDIANALHAGERWRADVRSAKNQVRLEDAADGQLLHLGGETNQVVYWFTTNTVSRRLGTGPWVRLLPNVKTSTMKSDPRQYATAWCWELELTTRTQGSVKPARVRPLFTFIAVPEKPLSK